MTGRQVTAEINLKNFAHNFQAVKKLLKPKTKIMAMVKGNAYGHGDVEISRAAVRLGADYLGVACLFEAQRLREAKIKTPILLVGYTDPADFPAALELNCQLNIMDEKALATLNKLALGRKRVAKIHVKIDTGMHRLGLSPDQALAFIPKIESFKNIKLVGIYSHFASSDEKSLAFTREQLRIFNSLPAPKGVMRHIANSAALLRLPASHLDMVRPGKIFYGVPPSEEFKMPFAAKPVMSLKTVIVQIHRLKKGQSVGYNRTFTTRRETLVATLPVGYGDGFRRAPKNWGKVEVHGQIVPVIGRVSMDLSAVDVTTIPNVAQGDEVTLIGDKISATDVAKALGTSSYEVTTSISSRVNRIFV